MPSIELSLLQSSSQWPVRVIVIDSIATFFRSDFENNPLDLRRRSSLFFKILGKLKSLVKRFGLAMVVTNQVVDFIGGCEGGVNGLRIGNLISLSSLGRRVCPALGLAWANYVNSRLFLSRDEEVVVVGAESGVVDGDVDVYQPTKTRRRLNVVFAPHLPAGEAHVSMAEAEPSETGQGHRKNAPKLRRKDGFSALAAKFFDENVPLKKRLRWLKRIAMVKDDGTVEFEVPGDIKPPSLDVGTDVIFDEARDEEFDEGTHFEDIQPLQIVMLIVGTREDVQPFVAIGKRLQEYGHRVRLATHKNFKDFVLNQGLEFYPLGGDPKVLASCKCFISYNKREGVFGVENH